MNSKYPTFCIATGFTVLHTGPTSSQLNLSHMFSLFIKICFNIIIQSTRSSPSTLFNLPFKIQLFYVSVIPDKLCMFATCSHFKIFKPNVNYTYHLS